MKLIIALILTCTLTGCASTEMKSFMGKDIREVILVSGPPVGAIDMGGGVRAFQFRWGGGSFAVPETTQTTGTATAYGNSAWLSATSITTGGGVYHSEGCIISYLTEWDESLKGWVITDYRHPKQLLC